FLVLRMDCPLVVVFCLVQYGAKLCHSSSSLYVLPDCQFDSPVDAGDCVLFSSNLFQGEPLVEPYLGIPGFEFQGCVIAGECLIELSHQIKVVPLLVPCHCVSGILAECLVEVLKHLYRVVLHLCIHCPPEE